MIKVTDAMIEVARGATEEYITAGGAEVMLEAVLNMPEVRLALLVDMTEALLTQAEGVTQEPQEIGAQVIDDDGDRWTREADGWHLYGSPFGGAWEAVRQYGPLRLVP